MFHFWPTLCKRVFESCSWDCMPEFISEARRLRQITHLPLAGYKKEQTTLPGVNFPISYCVAELCNGSTYDSDSYRLGSNPSSAAISRWASRQLSHLKDRVGFLLFYYHSSSPRKLACCAYALTSAVLLFYARPACATRRTVLLNPGKLEWAAALLCRREKKFRQWLLHWHRKNLEISCNCAGILLKFNK